ncbi:MAG: hypothetical protein ABR613_10715 [Actinomycetota bacterium]
MEFVLTYEGTLPAAGTAAQKHRIRRTLHPQLRELWKTHAGLEANQYLLEPSAMGSVVRQLGPFNFAPFVCAELSLLAALDVLLLRPGPPGAVISSRADLDNQLKTLLDALRAPLNLKELPTSESPEEQEDPFFCLLDDDRKVIDLRVRAEQLLDPTADPLSVRALIRVTVRAESWTPENTLLL